MAVIPVVMVGDNAAVLSLVVDDVTRIVTGWQCQNNTPGPCLVRLSNTGVSVGQAAPGNQLTTANIVKNRQWNFDGDSEMTYELTMVWSPSSSPARSATAEG